MASSKSTMVSSRKRTNLFDDLPRGTKVRIYSQPYGDVCQVPHTESDRKFFGMLREHTTGSTTTGSSSTFLHLGGQFAYEGQKTREPKDQFIVIKKDQEIHLYPTRGVYTFTKRIMKPSELQSPCLKGVSKKQIATGLQIHNKTVQSVTTGSNGNNSNNYVTDDDVYDINLAMQKMRKVQERPMKDRDQWTKERVNRQNHIGGDPSQILENLHGENANIFVSKRPYVKTGCEEFDAESQFLKKLEDPEIRSRQKFLKEDADFKKKRKLWIDEKRNYRKIEDSVPDTALGANFLKRDEEGEGGDYDWDGNEEDRFSDDEGNDGGLDENNQAELAPRYGLQDETDKEKQEKYGAGEEDHASLKALLKEDNYDHDLAKELAELSKIGKQSNNSSINSSRVGPSGSSSSNNTFAGSKSLEKLLEKATPAEKIDALFEGKNKGYTVNVKQIMSTLGIKDNSHPSWKQAIAHLKSNYNSQKSVGGQYLFSKK